MKIMIGAAFGFVLGIVFHGSILSMFDGVQLVKMDDKNTFFRQSTPGRQQNVGMSIDYAKCVSSSRRHDKSGDSSVKPWIYSDAENYYFVYDFPERIIPCSYYAKLIGYRIRRKDGKVFNRHAACWEPNGFIMMCSADVDRFLPTNTTFSTVISKMGYPLSTDFENGGLRTREGEPCVELRYLCQDGPVGVIMRQSVVVGVMTNNLWLQL